VPVWRSTCVATSREAKPVSREVFSMSSVTSGRRFIVNCIGRGQRAAFGSNHYSPLNFGLHRSLSSLGTTQTQSVARYKPPNKAFSQPPPRISLFSSLGGSSSDTEKYDWDTIFPFEKNHHNSVKITVPEVEDNINKNDPYNLATFHFKVEATIATARELHKSAIWISIPITRARLMEEAAKSGFEFHHAEGNIATLSKWLSEGEEGRIPTYATHQVGVGAIVINSSTDEILCVREKRNNYRPWKIPGGLSELGEDFDEAVIREVYEETGIRCKFMSVLGVRHVHGTTQFGRSDLFFVCRLEPISNENGTMSQPIPQEEEIEAATWLPLNEYRNMVDSDDSKIGHPMMSQIMKVVDQGNGKETDIQQVIVPSVVPGRENSALYHAPIH